MTNYRKSGDAWEHYSETWREWLPANPATVVLLESNVPAENRGECISAMHAFLNATSDAGRPSDAMRSVVASWEAGQLL